jgi:hypothetical protein
MRKLLKRAPDDRSGRGRAADADYRRRITGPGRARRVIASRHGHDGRHADDGTTTRRVLDRAPQHPGRYKKENAELKRANEILKAAASFFAAELCATRRDVDREAVKGRIRWAVAAA